MILEVLYKRALTSGLQGLKKTIRILGFAGFVCFRLVGFGVLGREVKESRASGAIFLEPYGLRLESRDFRGSGF